MRRLCKVNTAFLFIVWQVLLGAAPAYAIVTNCYQILGLSAQVTPEILNEQKEKLLKIDIKLPSSPSNNDSIVSMECFLSLANMIPKENHEVLLPYWKNVSLKSRDDFLLNYDHLDERMEFRRYSYYEYGQALYSVIASRIFKHFLPASPKAYLVFEESSDGKQILGVATESMPAVSLMHHYSDIYNKRIMGDSSRDKDCFSFKSIAEWSTLMTYLKFPMSNMGPIGIKNETQEIITIDYFGAFQDRSSSNEPVCVTSDSLFVLSCDCDKAKMKNMRERISREKADIKKIVHDAFEAFGVLSNIRSAYREFVYKTLLVASDKD